MKFSTMTSKRYYEVTHFLTDPNENCTAYVKLPRNKRHLDRENFLFFGIFIEKITIYYENHVYSAVTLHFSPHLLWATHYGPFTLRATHWRQAPHHPSGQQLRALQTGIQ